MQLPLQFPKVGEPYVFKEWEFVDGIDKWGGYRSQSRATRTNPKERSVTST